MLFWFGCAIAADHQSVALTTGGLRGAAQVLQARFAISIDVEEPAPTPRVDVIEVYSTRPEGKEWWPRVEAFRFDYDGGADEAIAAMLAAWGCDLEEPGPAAWATTGSSGSAACTG